MLWQGAMPHKLGIWHGLDCAGFSCVGDCRGQIRTVVGFATYARYVSRLQDAHKGLTEFSVQARFPGWVCGAVVALVPPTSYHRSSVAGQGGREGIGNAFIFEGSLKDAPPAVQRDFYTVLEAPEGARQDLDRFYTRRGLEAPQ